GYAHDYLAIHQVRLGERLKVDSALTLRAGHARVPPLILQPIVENSIKHGLGGAHEDIRISLEASVDLALETRLERLTIVVSDDGAGTLHTGSDGVGLRNVRSRLARMFADQASLRIESGEERGTRTTIQLPYASRFQPSGSESAPESGGTSESSAR